MCHDGYPDDKEPELTEEQMEDWLAAQVKPWEE